jgi:hypothetical protein
MCYESTQLVHVMHEDGCSESLMHVLVKQGPQAQG